MTVDNIEQISPLLQFNPNGQDCIMVQILQRKKDGNAVKVHGSNRNRCVKTYHFYTREQFEMKKQEIRDICEFFNARAYINLNPKPLMEILFKLSQMVMDTIRTMWHGDHPMSLVGLVDSAIAQVTPVKSKATWIIDIDEEDLPHKEEIIKALHSCKSGYDNIIIDQIPTVHGVHLITHRFDTLYFLKKYSKPDFVKKNSYTLLYAQV